MEVVNKPLRKNYITASVLSKKSGETITNNRYISHIMEVFKKIIIINSNL
jgi:hypothetical protein